MKGAFKTPTLRDIEYSAPYFHDGSATTLEEVIDHYVTGGVVKTNIAPNMKALALTADEKKDLIAFLKSLSSPVKPFVLPILPL
jgi:cytochrome c peroxidase